MVTQPEETPILIGQAGPLNGRQWKLNSDMILGRGNMCDIIIPDRQVSRNHARITHRADGYYIEDLGSKNGTHVNGNRIENGTFLNDGDVVQIALAQEIVYISADSTVPLKDKLEPTKAGRKRLYLEKRSRRVWIGKKELTPALSVAQFSVLELLYKQEGRVVSRDRLTEEVWGEEGAMDVSGQALDALIRRLRTRLAQVDSKHKYILTVRGHGLRLENPEQ